VVTFSERTDEVSAMQCLEVRRICDTEPRCEDSEYLRHLARCAECARYAQRARQLDALVSQALRIDVPPHAGAARQPARRGTRASMALAASFAAAVVIGASLWFGSPNSPGQVLAADVVEHIHGEPASLDAGQVAMTPAAVRALLARGAVRVIADLGPVVYGQICVFRGREVPHLVVQTEAGLVTVLVLAQERVAGPIEVAADGFRGRIVPSNDRSLAIVGQRELSADLERRIVKAIAWEA
jgi:hypothetical protein